MLEEILRRKEKNERIADLSRAKIQGRNVIQHAYYFSFQSAEEKNASFFEEYICKDFPPDVALSETVKQAIAKKKKVHNYYFKTSSANPDFGHYTFSRVASPMLTSLGYTDIEIERMNRALSELYLNAIIHGNHAGTIAEYEKRHMLEKLFPDGDYEGGLLKNKKKTIEMEISFTEDLFIARIYDQGEGFVEKGCKEEEACVLNPDNLKFFGRGLLIAKGRDEYHHIVMHRKTDRGFETTFIKYKPRVSGEAQQDISQQAQSP